MKKIIFFDLDQTIYNNDANEMPSQTKKLLEHLSKDPDVTLGLATGRSKSMLHMIAPYDQLFEYFVVINGGLVLKKDEVLFHQPISHEDMRTLIEDATKKDIILGMIGANDESITFKDERISYTHTGLSGFYPKIDDQLYLKIPIYQLWVIGKTQEEIFAFAKTHQHFQLYMWRMGGGDFIYSHVNKGKSIEKILKEVTYDQLICIGDGDNDFQMLEIADISIAMGNARSEALKKKADLVAPHIDDDQLYDFFLKHKLI